ncbi:hypothetical protein BD289DRAFT_62782 [Coniella lustricola]|uniref:DUF7702 domain-containing protein n=1 Tax=Coniella lustricola TaxID=2025994 RepID=A0A2T3A0E6_9PEZI|nr:hypothetical protein BD289DRAFT_62782 [Coniella lustricola]
MSSGSPPSASIIDLAIVDLILYAVLLPPAIFITWKHGKTGMICWPIFVSYFGLRFASDIYQIVNRNEPLQYNQVAIMTNAGSLACLSLLIIGLVYEANMILPLTVKSWTEKIILGVTHLANTGGIGVATYGGAPSPTGGVVNENLNQIGNCLMLFVMFAICWWMWPTWRRISSLPSHPNHGAALALLYCAGIAMPFHLVRLAYNTTYAFNRIPSLDPVTGSFATRLILMFLMQAGVSVAAIWGGWKSRNVVPKTQLFTEYDMSRTMSAGETGQHVTSTSYDPPRRTYDSSV